MQLRTLTFAVLLAVCACSPSVQAVDEPLPPGDEARGAVLFTDSVNGAPACAKCHSLDGTILAGPSLAGFGMSAETRVAGQRAAEYAHTSIVQPASHIVDGFLNTMYPQYAQQLTPQQIADLIAYLLTL